VTIHLRAIDLSTGPKTPPGVVRVRLTTTRGQRVSFDLAGQDAAELGASLSEHAGNV
jgi:hypothetical protein